MILGNTGGSYYGQSIPRESGDDPDSGAYLHSLLWYSPRERG